MEKSIEYIAGILDSGCRVTIEKQQNVYRGVITFHRQNRAVLEVVVQKFGGRIYPAKGGYRIKLVGEAAFVLARAVYPFMLTKRKELELLLDLATLRKKPGVNQLRARLKEMIHVKPTSTTSSSVEIRLKPVSLGQSNLPPS